MSADVVHLVTSQQPSPSFDDFITAYPKKYGVGAARAQWIWALGKTGNDATPIVEGAKRYAKHVQAQGLEWQFVLAPAKWLYEEHWQDVYELPNGNTNFDARAIMIDKQRAAAARGSRFAQDWLKREGLA